MTTGGDVRRARANSLAATTKQYYCRVVYVPLLCIWYYVQQYAHDNGNNLLTACSRAHGMARFSIEVAKTYPKSVDGSYFFIFLNRIYKYCLEKNKTQCQRK